MVLVSLWGRIRLEDQIHLVQVDGDRLRLFTGDLFGAPQPTDATVSVDGAVWEPPCIPTKMIALWNNFHAAATKNGWSVPADPLYFLKPPNSFSASGRPIPAPAGYDGRVLYEGELGIVIGRRTKSVSVEEASTAMFGYCCVNDVTALDLLQRDPSFPQWTRAKGFDGFAPFGPLIATGLAPETLIVRTLINGRERQNYPVSDMIFSPADLVCRLSQEMTLEPGDIISCGTSLGALPMRAGTTVEVVIDGVGTLTNVYG